MAWLWIISVGVSDVQFPVWSKDDYGQWIGPQRFEVGRAGVRAVHEGLLALMRHGQVRFDNTLPKAINRDLARELRLVFEQEGEDFLASIQHLRHTQDPAYRICGQADTLPNQGETQLPLYCPKVEALLPVARETFAGNPVTVLVLNTRRADGFTEAPWEPVGSGPLVAKCLAERLGLDWVDGQGQVPGRLVPGTSTWVDILAGDEAMEDSSAQEQVVSRLSAAIQAWNPAPGAARQIAVTTSGGMPPLKPLIERVPATCVGQSNVSLLDQPERGPATAAPLNYDTRVAERETLRFHCAEALRNGEYAGAYGLASRAANLPWARQVRDGLGPLLELSGTRLTIKGRQLPPFALTACQIEVFLCMGDVAGALKRLATLIESSTWELIAGDARIRELGLQPDRGYDCLVGALLPEHILFTEGLLERNSKGRDHHRVRRLMWSWPHWLKQRVGGQSSAAKALDEMRLAYNGEPQRFRNLLVHGPSELVDLDDVKRCMKNSGLIDAVDKPFGQNFLSATKASSLLTALGETDLTAAVSGHLKDVLNRVIEG
ncbi:hypothetical protein [uncultured Thiodictyon sp.]|uniref:hypothetical protein n=1 Tax=uncultured Thiodictyon sp. TaxID=1846217 RepID=UPI0025FC563A|nr:hypothetical protein [uncultured Thiodictyon sp.]